VGEIMVAEEWRRSRRRKGLLETGEERRRENRDCSEDGGRSRKYKGTQYVLDVGDGKECYTPNHAVLNKKLILVKVGSRVKIIYQGTGERERKPECSRTL